MFHCRCPGPNQDAALTPPPKSRNLPEIISFAPPGRDMERGREREREKGKKEKAEQNRFWPHRGGRVGKKRDKIRKKGQRMGLLPSFQFSGDFLNRRAENPSLADWQGRNSTIENQRKAQIWGDSDSG